MTNEDKLGAFLAADQAPASDPAFMMQFDSRLARIRLWSQLRSSAVLAIAIAAIAFGLYRAAGPQALSWVDDLALEMTSTPGLALASVIVVAAMYLTQFLQGRLKL